MSAVRGMLDATNSSMASVLISLAAQIHVNYLPTGTCYKRYKNRTSEVTREVRRRLVLLVTRICIVLVSRTRDAIFLSYFRQGYDLVLVSLFPCSLFESF